MTFPFQLMVFFFIFYQAIIHLNYDQFGYKSFGQKALSVDVMKIDSDKQSYYNINLRMAYILQELGKINECIFMKDSKDSNQSNFNNQSVDNLQQNISRLLRKQKTMYFDIQKTHNSIQIVMVYCNIVKSISLVFWITIKKPYTKIKITSKLLNFNFDYAVISGKESRKVVCKYLIDRDPRKRNNECNLCINMNTGQIKAFWPIFMFEQKVSERIISSIFCGILLKQENLKVFRQKISYILTMSNQNPKYYLHDHIQKNRSRKTKFKKLLKYIQNSTVSLNLMTEIVSKQLQIVKNVHKQQASIAKIKKNKQFIDNNLSCVQLYSSVDFKKLLEQEDKQKELGFKMTFAQRQVIKHKIMLPNNLSIGKSKAAQNYFILNHIQLKKDIPQNCIKKIKVGGFTTIYLAQIQYWNVLSSGNSIDNSISKYQHYEKHLPAHKKFIVIKRQTNKTQPHIRNRVAHQIRILKEIKNGVSMFLPKYYLLTQKDHSYKNDLLLDFIGFPNLSQYIKQNQYILSTNTKIYLIFMISQALRYLKEYQIAHLDLKPTNIMTYKRLSLKIIDFGQAYHPILKNNHEPGYSIPYTAPENFKNPQTFTHKNDVFSLGVIIHELFFSKYPYNIYSQRLKKTVFLQGDFQDYWFCSPQQKFQYGDRQVLQIIYQLIVKSLKYNGQQRPQLQWLSYVLVQLYDLTI